MSKNVCPHCGSDAVVSVPESDKNTRKFALCGDCEATGPTVTGSQRKAIDAFCRPAHIVAEYGAKIAKLKEIIVEQAEAINKGAELCAECMYKEASDEQD